MLSLTPNLVGLPWAGPVCRHLVVRLRASVYPPFHPQEELESYPLGAIVRCDAVLPPGRSRSLLLLVCQEPERAQPDVHFFQGLRLGVRGPRGAEGRRPGQGWDPADSGAGWVGGEGGAGIGRSPQLAAKRCGASKEGPGGGAKAGSGPEEGA